MFAGPQTAVFHLENGGEEGRVGNLAAVEMQDRQHRTRTGGPTRLVVSSLKAFSSLLERRIDSGYPPFEFRCHPIGYLVHVEPKFALNLIELVHQVLLVFRSENLAGQRE